MGKLTNEIFNESCCDGGECSTSYESAQPCGCDKGANHLCEQHKGFKLTQAEIEDIIELLETGHTYIEDNGYLWHGQRSMTDDSEKIILWLKTKLSR
jgi:hypothetical protein